MDCKYCIDQLNFEVKIADIETRCQYHKEKGAVYPPSAIAPRGLCRELFYAAYPACLAVLYNGMPVPLSFRTPGRQRFIASCPHLNGITVEIRGEEVLPRPLRRLKELVEEICKIIYRPLNGHFRRVVIEVTGVSSFCPKGYKAGDRFRFNTRRKDELCPAGFAAIYPYLRFMKGGGKDAGYTLNIHCPDYVGVTYEIISK